MKDLSAQTALQWFRLEIGGGWLIAALLLVLMWNGRRIWARLMSLRAISPTPMISRLLSGLVGTRH